MNPTPHAAEALGRPSRKAAIAVLEAHLAIQKGDPLRGALSTALKDAGKLGGHERRFAAFATRELSRHQRFLDLAARTLGHPASRWLLPEDRALVRYALWRRLYAGAGWREVSSELKLPGPIRPRTIHDQFLQEVVEAPLPPLGEDLDDPVERAATLHSLPNWLAKGLASSAPEGEAEPLFAALNREPRLFLRARPPGDRDERLAELHAEGIAAEPVPWAPDAIRVTEPGMRVFESAPMKKGLLQVQEPGSQLIAALGRIDAPRSLAVDACAGAGGKTLALADLLGAGGRVVATDKSRRRLEEARRRVREFGLRNVSFPDPAPVKDADLLLVDAPCSGTGSLAREPEQKWRLTAAAVKKFSETQREILESTAAALKPGAVLVYATCSLLREENEDVVAALLAAHPELQVEPAGDVLGPEASPVLSGPYLRVWPHRAEAGGFFAARLRRSGQGTGG
jgi:16S rRNA (cytosine967-C5)-methyltransferase